MNDHSAGDPAPPRRDTAATTRSQSVVHLIERNIEDVARLLAGVLDRADADAGPGVLVLTPSSDDALALSEALARNPGTRAQLVPVTSLRRGRRVVAAGARAIAGAPGDLSSMITESLIPMQGLRTVVLVWPEDLLDAERLASVEAILTEAPRAAERIAFASARSAELDAYFERAMWRARTVEHGSPTAPAAATLRVVACAPSERLRALRAVLDALDPASVVLACFSDEGESDARAAAAALGMSSELVRVERGVPVEHADLVAIFGDVPPPDAARALAAAETDLVAIVSPARVAALRKLFGDVRPFTWSGATTAARTTLDSLREELRGYVATGGHIAWVPVIEPLLSELDPVEVAAASIALLDRDRRKARRAAVASEQAVRADEARERPSPRRDDDRPARPFRREAPSRESSGRDSFTRERGFGGARHASGARDDRAPRGGGGRDQRGPRRGDDPRGQSGAAGERDRRPRREDAERRPRRDEEDRRPRRDDIERVPRAAREGAEWSTRGERLRNARRGPRGGDRP